MSMSFARTKADPFLLAQRDISPDFRYDERGARIAERCARLDKSPAAVRYFASNCSQLNNYYYWFVLGALWVSYTGWSDLSLWKKLLSSDRGKRETSLMKPSELRAYHALPAIVMAFRVHRPVSPNRSDSRCETDWIAYTLDSEVAARFAKKRDVSEVSVYLIDRADIVALFLRRGEHEILVLDRNRARFVRTIPVVTELPESEEKGPVDA